MTGAKKKKKKKSLTTTHATNPPKPSQANPHHLSVKTSKVVLRSICIFCHCYARSPHHSQPYPILSYPIQRYPNPPAAPPPLTARPRGRPHLPITQKPEAESRAEKVDDERKGARRRGGGHNGSKISLSYMRKTGTESRREKKGGGELAVVMGA